MASSTPTEADKALLKAKKDLEETRKELADERQTKRGEKIMWAAPDGTYHNREMPGGVKMVINAQKIPNPAEISRLTKLEREQVAALEKAQTDKDNEIKAIQRAERKRLYDLDLEKTRKEREEKRLQELEEKQRKEKEEKEAAEKKKKQEELAAAKKKEEEEAAQKKKDDDAAKKKDDDDKKKDDEEAEKKKAASKVSKDSPMDLGNVDLTEEQQAKKDAMIQKTEKELSDLEATTRKEHLRIEKEKTTKANNQEKRLAKANVALKAADKKLKEAEAQQAKAKDSAERRKFRKNFREMREEREEAERQVNIAKDEMERARNQVKRAIEVNKEELAKVLEEIAEEKKNLPDKAVAHALKEDSEVEPEPTKKLAVVIKVMKKKKLVKKKSQESHEDTDEYLPDLEEVDEEEVKRRASQLKGLMETRLANEALRREQREAKAKQKAKDKARAKKLLPPLKKNTRKVAKDEEAEDDSIAGSAGSAGQLPVNMDDPAIMREAEEGIQDILGMPAEGEEGDDHLRGAIPPLADAEEGLRAIAREGPPPALDASAIQVALESIPFDQISVPQALQQIGMISKRNAMDNIDNQRMLLMLNRKVNTASRVLLDITKSLAKILNDLSKYENPMKPGEKGISPFLNKDLEVLPFTTDEQVMDFFEIREGESFQQATARLLLLQRYIISQVNWSSSNFVYRMVKLVCNKAYRRTHFFPGNAINKKNRYVPEKFARFMFTVARLASTNIGGFDINKVNEQFRISFHKRSVSDTDWTGTGTDDEEDEDEPAKKLPKKAAKKDKEGSSDSEEGDSEYVVPSENSVDMASNEDDDGQSDKEDDNKSDKEDDDKSDKEDDDKSDKAKSNKDEEITLG